MPKLIYCSECGERLTMTPKAVKGYGIIVNLISPHICHEQPIPFDLEPREIPIPEPKGKFVRNLNNLKRPSIDTIDLRDRRVEKPEVKSTAPASILTQLQDGINSVPEGDIGQEPEGS